MGVIGIHVFDDDMACCHLAYCLSELQGQPFDDFTESLEKALASEYIETDISGEVLTIAMLLIGLISKEKITEMPQEMIAEPYRGNVLEFADRHRQHWNDLTPQERSQLVSLTIRSITEKVLNQYCCEAYELWLDTDDLDDWLAEVSSLRDLLSSLPPL